MKQTVIKRLHKIENYGSFDELFKAMKKIKKGRASTKNICVILEAVESYDNSFEVFAHLEDRCLETDEEEKAREAKEKGFCEEMERAERLQYEALKAKFERRRYHD